MNSDRRPRTISAIVPTYNRANLLCEAVDSILGQTCPVSEVIVVDDGSTDDTVSRMERYGTSIRYISQRNQGPAAARNHGIRVAQGDFVTFLDSDDLWVPQKVEMQLEFIERNPSVDFVFGRMANVFQDTGVEDDDFINAEARDYLAENPGNLERLFEHLIVQNFIGTPTLMARRESLARVGIFDEKRKIGEDLDYWLRAAVLCKWGFIDEVLIKRRRHTGNLISDWIRWNIATIRVLEEVAGPLSVSRPGTSELLARRLANLNYDIGSAYFKQGKMGSAYAFLSNVGNRRFKPRLHVKLMVSRALKRCRWFMT
jgi:glycosyltransferase involved in cell wall biosynthesis